MAKRLELLGQRFGMLTAIECLGASDNASRAINWLCQCDCGKQVICPASELKRGSKYSCGCKKLIAKSTRNGLIRTYSDPDLLKPISECRRNLDSQIKEARKLFKPIDKSQFNDDWMREPLY